MRVDGNPTKIDFPRLMADRKHCFCGVLLKLAFGTRVAMMRSSCRNCVSQRWGEKL